MKTDTITVLAIAAAALGIVYVFTRPGGVSGTGNKDTINKGGQVDATPLEVTNTALPGQPGWAWRYFTDGVAIGPDGSYYQGGTKIWSPA